MANALVPMEPQAAALQPQAMGALAQPSFKPDIGKYRRWFLAYETNKSDEIQEQVTHRRYYNAKQWTAAEKRKLKARGQAPIFDNRISRKIDFYVGVEQRMRRDPKAYPRTPKDEKSADVATAGMRYVCELNRWESIASDGTLDGLIDGIGVAFVGIKQGAAGLDPEIKHVQRDRFFYDPRSLRPDFKDARYMGLHLWMDVDEATERWPHMAEQIKNIVDRSTTHSTLAMVDQNHATAWGDFENRRLRVVEFWEKTPRGWHYCFFCGEIELESGISPYLDVEGMPDCPYEAWSPYVDEVGDRYGPVRNMIPMQDEVNHRRSKFLHMNTTKQMHYRSGDLKDPDETRRQLVRPDGMIEHNGEWGKTTGIVDHSADIAGQAELLAQAQASLENLGPNPGLVGKGGGVADQSGRAILAQRDSGMTELSPVFERNRDWKLRIYRKVWARIRQAWTGEKWIRITDEDDAPAFIGVNQYGIDPMTGMAVSNNVLAQIDVDIVMDEGPDTMTMNEELLQSLQGNPAVPPKVFIELSNAPNKERLFKLIDEATAPNPQIAEMQARMAKIEEMMAAANVDKTVAETEAKRAETVTKLAQAFTPQQAPTDEFGNPMGPPPGPPDMMSAFAAMQAFPLQYGQPTMAQLATMAPMPQLGGEEEQQGEMQPNAMTPMPPQAGAMQGLPIDPMLAGA